ncbi:hypothetical protein F5051DRAFT_441084 [Lentinula edodes]|nr:hypothetical protein F5051DRAFT_441084 [Lentinula edodes]
MEPDSITDSETGSPTPSGWWRKQTYDYCSYYLDGDGIIQKIYHDPDVEESRTRGRAKTPPPQKGALKKTEILGSSKHADRGSTPVSFEPQARPPKYFLRGNPRTSDVRNDSFGPTKLETNRFRSHDSEGETAWHYSQSPNDLDAPPPETATPRMLGTIYVHKDTRDGGYQLWVWCNHEGRERELGWRPVDLENEQFAHPKFATRSLKLTSAGKPSWVLNSTLTTYRTRSTRRSRSRPATGSTLGFTPEPESRACNFLPHSYRDDDRAIDSEDETIEYCKRSSEDSDTDRSILNGSSSTLRPTTSDFDITENLILGFTTSAFIPSTTDTQILRKMEPVTTSKPIIRDSQIPESTDNATMPSKPEALSRQMTTEHIMSAIEDIPVKASSLLTTDIPMRRANSAGSLPGQTMDNRDTSKTNASFENSAYPSQGSGRPSEGSECHLEESGCPKHEPFQNMVIDHLQLSQVLFKAGALMYLLFLIRVLQKIYAMFRSQPLTVSAGNLTLSVLLFLLIQYHPPKQAQLRVVQKVGVTPE